MQNSPLPSAVDVLLVGSGINALVAAALLAKSGQRVCVLERNAVLGGCIRTDELTLPGFQHDTLSTAHPLFMVGPTYAALAKDLHAAGLEYCNTAVPTGVLKSSGEYTLLRTDRQANVQQFEAHHTGDGAAYSTALDAIAQQAPLLFSLLGNELWRLNTLKMLAKTTWQQGAQGMTQFVGSALLPLRPWLTQQFGAEAVGDVLAPWVLHCGLGPDAPLSAMMAQVVAFTLEAVGMPIVKGGNANTVRAFERIITQHGGSLHTDCDVTRVEVQGGKATGVHMADGRVVRAREVVCSVTPTQLYQRLLAPEHVPQPVAQAAQNWRYGKGNMQIHLALSAAPAWPNADLAQVAYLHLSDGADAVSRAVNEAERGLLPANPTICVAQPTALDPSRAPAGQHILWVQLPECPRAPLGDAAGQLAVDAARGWTQELREAYADRIIDRIAAHVPNLKHSIIGHAVLAPPDLEKLNINLVGGDPYGGDCSLDQAFLWRPNNHTRNHATHVAHLWHIGASTHPGPGLGGGSGFHIATTLGAKT